MRLVGDPLPLAADGIVRGAFESEARVVAGMSEHDHKRALALPEQTDASADQRGADAPVLAFGKDRHRREAHAGNVPASHSITAGAEQDMPTILRCRPRQRENAGQFFRRASTMDASVVWPKARVLTSRIACICFLSFFPNFDHVRPFLRPSVRCVSLVVL